jgi:histidinol-phosphate/aromatic aminotransferase/cobyric acid decarboxylase-like protein
MSADRLTRRAALIGAAAILAPLTPNILVGAPSPKTDLLKLDGNENPYGPSPAARRAILASVGEAPRYADATVAALVNHVPNLIVLRTFSKLHGLAGLRIGYAIAPAELAPRLAALSLTWPNTTGLSAAIASFNDHAFLKATRAALIGDRAKVHATLDRLGLARANAQGNFVFFDTGGPLKQFQDRMLAEGIKVGRHFEGYDTWARVTIGLHRDVDRFLRALPRALSGR